MLNLSSIAQLPQRPAQASPDLGAGPVPQPQKNGIDPQTAKDIIAYCKYQFDSYHKSQIFQNWRAQSEAIADAIEQRYRTNEQVTRSGFYLAALRAQYDGLKEGAVNVFAKANPLFIYRKRGNKPQAVADKIQDRINEEWDLMDGMEKFHEIMDDVWQFGTGISYTKWQSIQKWGQFPVVVPQVWGGSMIDWQEGYQTISNGPELERIHPMNWAGDFRRNRQLSWEGCMREWRVNDVQCLTGDSRYFQDSVQKLLQTMKDGKSTLDPYYFHPYDLTGGLPYKTSPRIVAYEYWGDLNGVKGFEEDGHEYVVMWADDQLLRFNHNPIYIGGEQFRPFVRTRSSVLNNFPMGRSILGPNLTHQKLQNLMVNLSVDDIIIRQHLGIAAWADSMENINDLTNPEGARGFVWMKNTANANMLPRFIGEGRSGIMQDSMDFMDRFIKPDAQKSGINDLSLGLKEGAQNGTATAAQLLASVGNRRNQAAITQICKTGLRPIAKHLTLLILRNRTMQEMSNFGNDEILSALQYNDWEEHDSITEDPYQQSMNKAEFYNMAKDMLMQVVASNGDASHVIEFLRDIARDKGIKPDDFNRYFPLAKPVDANAPAGGAPPPTQQQQGAMPGVPAQPSPPPTPTSGQPPQPSPPLAAPAGPPPPNYIRAPQPGQGQPPPPSDPLRASLALKGPDLHDPLVISVLKAIGSVPPDTAEEMTEMAHALPMPAQPMEPANA